MKPKINRNSLKNYFIVFLGVTLGIQSVLAASGMFPKMLPATNVYVVDCQQDSGDARMTAWALQGLVNQSLAEVYIIEKEKSRLAKEEERAAGEIKSLTARLKDKNFLSKAPEEVVSKQKAYKAELEARIKKLKENLKEL